MISTINGTTVSSFFTGRLIWFICGRLIWYQKYSSSCTKLNDYEQQGKVRSSVGSSVLEEWDLLRRGDEAELSNAIHLSLYAPIIVNEHLNTQFNTTVPVCRGTLFMSHQLTTRLSPHLTILLQ